MNLTLRHLLAATSAAIGLSLAPTSVLAAPCPAVSFDGTDSIACQSASGSVGSEELDVDGFYSGGWTKLVSGGDGGVPGPVNFGGFDWTLKDPLSGGGGSGSISLQIAEDATPGTPFNFELLISVGDSDQGVQEFVAYLISDATTNPSGIALTPKTYSGTWSTADLSIPQSELQNLTVFARTIRKTPTQLPEPGSILLLGTAALAAAGIRRSNKR